MKSLAILCDGPQTFRAMFRAIASAKKKIAFEIYQFAPDETGKEFVDALTEASKRGVDVRVVFDSLGSFSTPASFFDPLLDAGGRVVEFHTMTIWNPFWALSRRNHRKMLLVDEDLAIIGGLNIADRYRLLPSKGGYHDLAIEVRGPAAQDGWTLFDRTWKGEFGFSRNIRKLINWFSKRRNQALNVQIVGNDLFRDRMRIRRSILHAIRNAKKSVDLMNPYFLPSYRVLRALRKAAKRGIRVRVVVPGEWDIRIVDLASLIAQRKLANGGVEVFRWPGVVHAKAVLVDDQWFSIGSFNFDPQSLIRNLEVVVNGVDEECGIKLKAIFDQDVVESSRMSEEVWFGLPWSVRLLARFFYRLRTFL